MPFQDPVNRGRIVSTTLTPPSAPTRISASKRSMTSVRCAATGVAHPSMTTVNAAATGCQCRMRSPRSAKLKPCATAREPDARYGGLILIGELKELAGLEPEQ